MAIIPSPESLDLANSTFNEYFIGVGKVVHAWNHFQEELAKLFCIVSGFDETLGFAAWHSLKSDAAQRDMLKAVLAVATRNDDWIARFPKAECDITWLLSRAEDVADKRNNAVHAPCSIAIADPEGVEVISIPFSGNRRAKNLRGKDILLHFEWYEEFAQALKRHVKEIQFSLTVERAPWPDRPKLPVLRHRPAKNTSTTEYRSL